MMQLGAHEWLVKRIGPGQLMCVVLSNWIVCMFTVSDTSCARHATRHAPDTPRVVGHEPESTGACSRQVTGRGGGGD